MSVDISGVDKVELLRSLWKNSNPAIYFTMNGINPPHFDEQKAKNAVTKYIDYFDGRCIKTDISGNTASPHMYDRDYGQGKFAEIVESLK